MTDRIDFEQVREAVRIAAESEIAELEIETPTLKVRVRKATPNSASVLIPDSAGSSGQAHRADAPMGGAHHNPVPAHAVMPGAAIASSDDHLVPAVAPMVGTFYRAPSPEAQPFVKEGDVVDEGQTICIIEAMKLFNEIQAEVRGRVAKVLVENASPVEYGQPLFLLDTSAARG